MVTLSSPDEARRDYCFALALAFLANAVLCSLLVLRVSLGGIAASSVANFTRWTAVPFAAVVVAGTYVRLRVPKELTDQEFGRVDVRSIRWRPNVSLSPGFIRGWIVAMVVVLCWATWLVTVDDAAQESSSAVLGMVSIAGVIIGGAFVRRVGRDESGVEDRERSDRAPSCTRLVAAATLFIAWAVMLLFSSSWPFGVRLASLVVGGLVLNMLSRRLLSGTGGWRQASSRLRR